MSIAKYFFIAVLAAININICNAQGDSVSERLKALEEANLRILNELAHSRTRNRELVTKVGELRTETEGLREARKNDQLTRTVDELTSSLEYEIGALNGRIDETRFSTPTKSGLPLRFYGFVRQDVYYNDSRVALDPILVFAVLPEGGENGDNDNSFAIETRLVRFGFDVDGGRIGSADVTAKLESDFANFILARESRQTPRIRLAYINFGFGDFSIRVGQDWDVISPLYPGVHNELLLWGAGNLGDRRPQIQIAWNPETSGPVGFKLEASLAPSGAVDGVDNDGSPNNFRELDGYDAGHPQGQLRIAASIDSHVEGATATLGVWGYIAGIETDTNFNGQDHFMPWVVGFDLDLPIANWLTLRMEGWYGQALSDVRGNILQSINQVAGDEIRGWGGWGELRFQATDEWMIALGASIDNPRNGDLASGQRSLNWTAYISTKYSFGSGLSAGLDLMYWRTEWADLGDGDLVRIGTYVQFNF